MRFSLYINQPFALRHGLNVQQALLFSFFYELPSWANSVTLEGVPYYLATKSKIIDELPLLTDKPDTVYRLAKALRDKGLIEIKVIDSKTYYRTTALGATWNDAEAGGFIRGSEKNPGGAGKFSEGGAEKNPTYNTTNINNTTNNNIIVKSKKFQKSTHAQVAEYLKEKQQQLDIDYFIDYYESKDWMIGKNRMKNWKSAINNWLRNEKNYATNKQRKLTQAERTEIAVNELLNG